VGFSKHMRPSARASRVGLSQKSSVLSSIDVFVLSVSPSIEKLPICFVFFFLVALGGRGRSCDGAAPKRSVIWRERGVARARITRRNLWQKKMRQILRVELLAVVLSPLLHFSFIKSQQSLELCFFPRFSCSSGP